MAGQIHDQSACSIMELGRWKCAETIFDSVRQNNFEQLEKQFASCRPDEIDTMDENGNTALLIAAFKGHLQCVELLLKFGADALHINRMGVNSLTLAAYSGNLEILELLLRHGTLDHFCQTTFVPPISAAVIAGHQPVVEFFATQMDKEAPMPKTIEGITPLMLAIIYNRTAIYNCLLQLFPNEAKHRNALTQTAADLVVYKRFLNL